MKTVWILTPLVLTCHLFLSGCGEGKLSSDEYLSRAETSITERDYKAAIIELKNALSENRTNPEARFLLGKVYNELEDGASAEKELLLSQKQGVIDESVIPQLARALLLQEKFQDVLDLNAPFQGWAPKAKSSFLTSRGLALLSLGRNSEALQAIDNALGFEKDATYALLAKTRIKEVEGNLEEARTHLDRIFQLDDEYGHAWSLLGDIERYAGNLKEAEDAYSRAIEFRSVAYQDILSRSLVRIGLQKLDEAEKDINTLAALVKNHPDVSYAQGLLYFYKNVYGDAQLAFEKVLSVDGNYLPALLYAGASHYLQGNKESAESYLARFVANNPHYLPASRLLALIKLEKKDYGAAEQLIKEASAGEDLDEFTMTILANALMGQNKVPEGLGYLQNLASLQPDSAQIRKNLGLGLLRKGDTEAAVSELEIANKLDPNMRQAGVRIVLIHLANKQFDKALDAALSYKDRNQNAEGHLLLGGVYMARNEVEKATDEFAKTVELDPGNTSANSALAVIAIQSKDLEKAKGYYLNTLEKHPGHLGTLVNLAMVNSIQGNIDAMKSNLSTAIESNPEALEPRLILGQVYLRERNTEKTVDLLSGFKEKSQSNLQFLTILAEAEVKTGKWPEAKRTLSRIVELAPGSAAWRFQLAKANAQLGSKEDYRNELQKTLETAPDHLEARMALTDLLLREGNKDAAREHVRILKERSDNSSNVLVLEGRLEELSGNKESAARAYQEAFDKAKNNINLLIVSNYKWKNGERSEAVEMLETWLKEYPNDDLTWLELANRYLSLEKLGEAESAYRQVIKTFPNNVMSLNNLSFLLLEKNPAESLSFAKQASDLAPQSPELKDTLALALMHSGDVTQARKVIEKVVSMRPENSTYRYHQAMILQKAGDRDEALSVLQPLVEQENEFPEKAAALALYREISEK